MNKLVRRIDLETRQYGLRPKAMFGRLRSDNSAKILANSIPKSGTNLLSRSLYLLPDFRRKLQRTLLNSRLEDAVKCLSQLNKKQFCMAHLKYDQQLESLIESQCIGHVLMVRDPRDVAVSSASYLTRLDRKHRLHPYFSSTLADEKARIEAVLHGISSQALNGQRPSLGLIEHYNDYLGWCASNAPCLIIRFEDLVGERGGGSRALQLLTLESLYQHLGISYTDKELRHVAEHLFSSASRTFDKGVIGRWVEVFDRYQIDTTIDGLPTILGRFGYAT